MNSDMYIQSSKSELMNWNSEFINVIRIMWIDNMNYYWIQDNLTSSIYELYIQ